MDKAKEIEYHVFRWTAIAFMWAFIIYLLYFIVSFLRAGTEPIINQITIGDTSTSTISAALSVPTSAMGPALPDGSIPNDTLLALIGLIITFVSLLSYIFKRLVQQEIEKKYSESAKMERLASKAEAATSATVALIHSFFYLVTHDPLILQKIVDSATLALKHASLLDSKNLEYKEIIRKCENNLALGLAAHSIYVTANSEKYESYKRRAHFLSKKNLQETEKESKNSEEAYTFHFAVQKTTQAIVTFVFAENEEQKQEACNIIKSVVNDMNLHQEKRDEARFNWNTIHTKMQEARAKGVNPNKEALSGCTNALLSS